MIQIARQGNRQVLLADGKPFIMIAGEVHNSDSSSPEYMEHIWEISLQEYKRLLEELQ